MNTTELDEAAEQLKREGYWDLNGSGTLEHISPFDLEDSPINYRKSYPKESIEEIASTAKDVGILESLMARPAGENGELRELVFGHRRKRAAIKVGLETVPVLVRRMTDKEVRLAQLIENGAREDVHPLEEADGLKALLVEEEMAIQDIAAHLAKPLGYIYRRLSLTHLCEKGRKAFLKGELRTGVAELIARLADPKAQAEAVKDLAGESREGGLITVKAARRCIERNYLRELKEAPFDPKDAELVESAGKCSACPKRTGANVDLFGDLQGKNVCTDGVCYEEKARAEWRRRKKEHKAEGGAVLEKRAEVSKVFPYRGRDNLGYNTGFSDIDRATYSGEPSPAVLLDKKKIDLPPITLARDPAGGIRRLVKTTDLNKAMRAIGGGGTAAGAGRGSTPLTPAQKKKADREKQDAEVKRRVGRLGSMMLAMKMAPEHLDAVGFWQVLAELAIRNAWHDTCKATCKRRELEVPKGGRPEEVLLKHSREIASGKANPDREQATTCELLAVLALEVMTNGGAETNSEEWRTAALFLGIDRKALEKRARGELAAEKKAKTKPKAKKKTRKKKKART